MGILSEKAPAKKKGRPVSLRGLRGIWLALSAVAVILVALTAALGIMDKTVGAVCCAAGAAFLLIVSNFWFGERVTNPLLGLGDTARRIADGSYGTRFEKRADDEIGDLTDAINDMSVKIGAANKTQTDFISSVSHELRTPLTAITGWSETILYDEAVQGDSRRGVEIISKEAGQLTSMVEELLEFTRIRDGRFNLNVETVDVTAILSEVAVTYGNLFRHENLDLRFTPSPVPPVTGDPQRIKQVVLNILDNAVKYGKGGGSIEMSVRQDGEYVKIAVRDHGGGFSARDLTRAKEKFYKGSSKIRGSGIGLSICDEIVSRHGGTLTVANAESGGGLVTVALPVITQ